MSMSPRQIIDAAYSNGWHDARVTFFAEIIRVLDTMTAPATSPHRCTLCGGLLEIGQDVKRTGTNSSGTSLFAHTTCPDTGPTEAGRQAAAGPLATAAAEQQPPAQTPAPAPAAPVPSQADVDDTRPMVTLPDTADRPAQDPA